MVCWLVLLTGMAFVAGLAPLVLVVLVLVCGIAFAVTATRSLRHRRRERATFDPPRPAGQGR